MFIRIFLFFLLFVGNAGLVFSKDLHKKFDSIANKINEISFYQDKKAEELLYQLKGIVKKNPDKKSLQIHYLYWSSYHNYMQGKINPDVKDSIYKCIKTTDENSHNYSILLHSLALNEVIDGNYTDALTHALTALKYFQKSGDAFAVSHTLQLLGVICYRTKNFELSEKFSQQTIGLSVPKLDYYKSLINQYSVNIFISDKPDSALVSMLKLEPILVEFNHPGLKALLYLNIGCGYFYSNQFDKAHVYFEKLLEMIKNIDNKFFHVSVYLNLSSFYLAKNDYDLAEKYIRQAKLTSSFLNSQEQLAHIYNLTFNLYDQIGEVDSAHQYLKKYHILKNNLLNTSGSADSYEAYVSSFLESAEKEVAIANQLAMLDKRKFTIAVVSCVFIILLAISILIIWQQRKKQQNFRIEMEKERLKNQLLHEREIQQVETEKHKQVVDAKKREITSYSLILSNKNDVLQKVLVHNKELKSNNNSVYNNINRTVQNSFNSDVEITKFMLHFNEVHPDFYTKLKLTCPKLTENNMRMCAYFKMGISPKQVASIMNISLETVKNGRYRLKKKLKLMENENLDDFIRNV